MNKELAGTIALGLAPFVLIGAMTFGLSKCASADELWVDSGMFSHHNNEGHYNYNQNNTGVGISYKMSPEHIFVIGEYTNSLYVHTNYIGVIYQPWHIGPVNFGVFTGLVTGYTKGMAAIPVAIPTATYEYKSVGVNIFWIPTVVVAAQVKIKVLEW